MADEKPVQHTPKHVEGGVFDARHPAASAFAPAQPGAGVVSDDAADKGQNLAGGPTASEASETFSDQKDVLAEQHQENLKVAAGVDAAEPVKVDEKAGTAKPADKSEKSADKK